uniref:MIP20116p n=1 Tax=Drosophila melanogaster TaxID=7227 RepID=D5A7P5_DROME|nr:MIP20116p [Drosophila melanogaster]
MHFSQHPAHISLFMDADERAIVLMKFPRVRKGLSINKARAVAKCSSIITR